MDEALLEVMLAALRSVMESALLPVGGSRRGLWQSGRCSQDRRSCLGTRV